jgi:hypothetical protein
MSSERLLAKPLQGGLFGDGEYALASMPCVAHGLHSVRYLVIRPRAGTVVAVGEEKGEVLAAARRVITAAGDLAAANDGRMPLQGELWSDEDLPELAAPAIAAAVPRRRREVFERSQGRCHYCGAALTLDGGWHVEHQLPRALGGGDDGLNLVAACVRCNLQKSDRTAIEFVASALAAE